MGKLIDQTVLRNCLKILGRGGGQVVSVSPSTPTIRVRILLMSTVFL